MRDNPTLACQQTPDSAYVKSSYSGGGSGSECLEVAKLIGGVRVRDSKNPNGPTLNLRIDEFQALIAMVKEDGTPLAG